MAVVSSCSSEHRAFDEASSSASGAGGADGAGPDVPAPVYARCADLPATVPSGVYSIQPPGVEEPLSLYCETKAAGGGWALLFNSIGSDAGTTTPFWHILYVDRFALKGTPSPKENFYLGRLYIFGTEYRDEIEDLAHKVTEVLHAKVSSFNPNTMGFGNATRVDAYKDTQGGAAQTIFNLQFNGGWSSADHDGGACSANCATTYANVTQHYSGGWAYNLGADADTPFEDNNWGPHINSSIAAALSIATDGTGYSRVNRISRWVRW